MTVDRLLTAEELAERLRVKTEWVWAQARAGRIPHVQLGRYRRFRESAIEAWLSELETGGAADPLGQSNCVAQGSGSAARHRYAGRLRPGHGAETP